MVLTRRCQGLCLKSDFRLVNKKLGYRRDRYAVQGHGPRGGVAA